MNPTTHKKIVHHDQVGFNPESPGCFDICKSMWYITSIKNKSYMIILIYAGKTFDEIQHPFMVKKKKNLLPKCV